jgi:HNH endonuclease
LKLCCLLKRDRFKKGSDRYLLCLLSSIMITSMRYGNALWLSLLFKLLLNFLRSRKQKNAEIGMSAQPKLRELDRQLDKLHASRSQKQKLKAEIKQRFGGTCAYCGCTPRFLTLDHIVPQNQGGLNTRSNLAAVCQRCNRDKGSRPLWQWWQASSCWNEERVIRFAATVLVCKI